LFNKMLMELKEEYERLRCPIERYCPYCEEDCLGNYEYCPIYVRCRDAEIVVRCIFEAVPITWRDIPSLINRFLEGASN